VKSRGLTTYKAARTGAIHVAANLKASGIAVPDLGRYWPKDTAPKPRKWIFANIDTGNVEEVNATLRLRLLGGTSMRSPLDKVAGTLTGKGLTIHYLKPMPPITDAAATGSFNADQLLRELHGRPCRRHPDRQRPSRHRRFQQIGADDQGRRELARRHAGRAGLLDHPRLGYMKRLGIDPKASEGQTTCHITVVFPADKDLVFEQVDLTARSQSRRCRNQARDVRQGSR